MPINADRLILTAQPEAAVIALNEIQKLDAGARPLLPLNREARLISLPGGYDALIEKLSIMSREIKLIFVRHMFPVQYSAPLAQADLSGCLPLPGGEFDRRPFSVQMRSEPSAQPLDNDQHAESLALLRTAESELLRRGFTQDDKAPAWVLSLFVHEGIVYAGASWCTDNRSAWNGGAMRFKKDEQFISRAEFKLLEAFSVFGIPAPHTAGAALDLGAAPGGWTRALLDRGYSVTAIDPAVLDERLDQHPRLTHFKEVSQRFHHKGEPFALIVNDMRMDLYESCRIMNDMSVHLSTGGKALITLKLTPGQWYKKTRKALTLLENQYKLLDARQLFHNRDEVTVYLTSIRI